MTSILRSVHSPADLRRLSMEQLAQLAGEIRQRIIEVVSRNGGHLASNLGVTELTLALHRVFDFSTDRLLWDVGHQCYVHKLITGRNDAFDTLRQAGGISGFPSTAESPFDLFDVGHAGTSIATAVGMARGDSALGRDTRVVALIGDASIVNGVAFEGLNQAGTLKRQFLVVLNDNSMGIAKTQGALASYLARFRVSSLYEEVKGKVRKHLPKVPLVGQSIYDALDHLKEGLKATVSPHQIFEQLGFLYVGPVDGHDLSHLVEMLALLKDVAHPVLLHVHTEKGRGSDWAASDPCTFHSPNKFQVAGATATIPKSDRKSWTSALADAVIDLASADPRVYALTAAMPDGTGLAKVRGALPERVLDCGIAESSTVDIAAGMARSGLRPLACIYSTFLQRAFDQVFQEVVLQRLPVVFCIDRAGLVGGDGAVHHGYLDIAYLRGFQNMVLMAPADEPELAAALRFALSLEVPCALRYPRDSVPDAHGPAPDFELGRSRPMRDGPDGTILAYGSTVADALQAARTLADEDVFLSVVNARFAKPIDHDMITTAVTRGGPVITVEDHSLAGGFGSAVLETANRLGLPTESIVRLGLAVDHFYKHGSRRGQLAEAGIDAAGIAAAARRAVQQWRAATHPAAATPQPGAPGGVVSAQP
ncbi:MAG: 1-deoxy-D-xylulose-5-phosphate synthase [Phycisphaerae bacterium]|nr:1-deoxy-D-xylulose-5-phosphate synthase [Phycisphaerae bacterium]MCZ2399558.1 1-deoxy-D-xylulose-5-phosphate synthase [Phycisphaerae bacterium]